MILYLCLYSNPISILLLFLCKNILIKSSITQLVSSQPWEPFFLFFWGLNYKNYILLDNSTYVQCFMFLRNIPLTSFLYVVGLLALFRFVAFIFKDYSK